MWRDKRQTEGLAKENSLGQKCVDTFFPVHELSDSQIDSVAGQDVGLLTVETLFLDGESPSSR